MSDILVLTNQRSGFMTINTKRKTVFTRRNKNYTSIFITDFSDETLQEVIDIDANEQYSVIKLKKSAVEDYIRRYNPIEKINTAKHKEVGYQFEIAGYYFTRIEDIDGCYITLRDETAYANGRISDFGMFSQRDMLMNEIFQHKTGRLLGF